MQRIPESELIINERGAIYHLAIRPEELSPNIITVGDPDRVAAVSSQEYLLFPRALERIILTLY